MTEQRMQNKKAIKKKGGNWLPALCGVLGTLILLFVIALCAPLTLPRLFGYEIFHVVSGSMEPAIPIGSAVYAKAVDPLTLAPGDIIVYLDKDSPVTHRVAENRKIAHELVTKGDANESVDFAPVPYEAVVGRVERHFPMLGRAMALLASPVGKAYLLCFALCGAMFNILGVRIRERRRELRRAAPAAETPSAAPPGSKKRGGKRRGEKRKRIVRTTLLTLSLLVFTACAAGVILIKRQYRESERLYRTAAETFTAPAETPFPAAPAREQESAAAPETAPEEAGGKERAPIRVDFEALRAVNPDVIGWLYCPDSAINYPVLLGESNDSYLRRSYDGSESAAGSIFAEASNRRDLSDRNLILYGHNMRDGSMFAELGNWQDQRWFDAHPLMWLLTPEGDYRVVLYSAHTVSAYDEIYTVFRDGEPGFDRWVKNAASLSASRADFTPDPAARQLMLSTCSYAFAEARAVLHGELQPLDRD